MRSDEQRDDNDLPAGQAQTTDLAEQAEDATQANAGRSGGSEPGRMSSGAPREVDAGAGTSGQTGNTGGTGGGHGASTDNGGNAGLTVGNGGGPSEGTLGGEPPPRQTSDLIGTGGTLDDRPSSGTGHTSLHGGGVDPEAASIGRAKDQGIPGARKA